MGPDMLENHRRRVSSTPQLASVQDVQQARRPGRGVTSTGHSASRPLRDELGRHRSGRKDLDPEERTRVLHVTLRAVKTAKAAERFLERDLSTIIEALAKSEGHPHFFELDEFTARREKNDMRTVASPPGLGAARQSRRHGSR